VNTGKFEAKSPVFSPRVADKDSFPKFRKPLRLFGKGGNPLFDILAGSETAVPKTILHLDA
jgi:hypothetical protein